MNHPTTVNGKVIMTQVIGIDPETDKDDGTEYARWVSSGHDGAIEGPTYSIQRFNYRTDNKGRRPVSCAPYHRIYYRGFKIESPGGYDEFSLFDNACQAIDRHRYSYHYADGES